MPKAIIRAGDPTSHGGTVKDGFSHFKVYGKPAAGVGHGGYCPQCKRDFLILSGVETFRYMGHEVAVEGMQTSCGAVLQATQQQAKVAAGSGGRKEAESGVHPAKENALAYQDRFVIQDQYGEPLAHAEYALMIAGSAPEFGTSDAFGRTHLSSTVAQQHPVDIFLEG